MIYLGLEFKTDEEVVREYGEMVYKLAYSKTGTRHDSDDIFQEVFIRYVKKQAEFRDENHRKAWLIRVTINCSNNFFNKALRRKSVELKEVEGEMYQQEDKQELDLYKELQKIPKKYREVIHLYYYEELTTEEISVVLKRRSSTIRTQLTRARKLLKEFIKEEDYYD
ncbi:MAG: sigma-70 family RNA polymerase sigma factor [bacterium]